MTPYESHKTAEEAEVRNKIIRNALPGTIFTMQRDFVFWPNGARFIIIEAIKIKRGTYLRKHEQQDNDLGSYWVRVEVIGGEHAGIVVMVPTTYLTNGGLQVFDSL